MDWFLYEWDLRHKRIKYSKTKQARKDNNNKTIIKMTALVLLMSEAYLKPSGKSKMELFVKIVK